MAPIPTTTRGQKMRQTILAAAVELIAEKGAAGMSLDDVKARTGASRSQLYHYFDDRDDLIRAVVAETSATVLAGQEALLAKIDSWTALDRWFDALVAFQEQHRARGGCPIGSLVGQLAEHDPEARTALARGLDAWEQHLRQALERMQAKGKLAASADPATLATATMASIQGGLLLTQARRDPQQLRIALDAARTALRAVAR